MLSPSTETHTLFSVHILSGDLILHKRTLGPVKSLIYALRRYDVDRTAASLDVSESEDTKVIGYMSHKSKTYLVGTFLLVWHDLDLLSLQADVYDHIEYVMASLDMYGAMAENLINYSFNVRYGS
jgi:hypothetical protein